MRNKPAGASGHTSMKTESGAAVRIPRAATTEWQRWVRKIISQNPVSG